MKKLLILIACCVSLYAQGQTTRLGNTFVLGHRTTGRDTIVTKYNYQARDGKTYSIVVNKKSGACYVWKISKNGKGYRQYMTKEIKETICSEMKIRSNEKTGR